MPELREPDLDDVPEDPDAEADDAGVPHTAGVDLTYGEGV